MNRLAANIPSIMNVIIFLVFLKNKYGTVIYIGRTNDLRHRISSKNQTHPTKKALRKEATHFTYQEMPKKKRRAYEKKKKVGKKHNHV